MLSSDRNIFTQNQLENLQIIVVLVCHNITCYFHSGEFKSFFLASLILIFCLFSTDAPNFSHYLTNWYFSCYVQFCVFINTV